MREAALAVGGIESFLVRVEGLLAKSGLCPDDFAELDPYVDVHQRIEYLGDSLDSLYRSLHRLREAITKTPASEQQRPDQKPSASTTA